MVTFKNIAMNKSVYSQCCSYLSLNRKAATQWADENSTQLQSHFLRMGNPGRLRGDPAQGPL